MAAAPDDFGAFVPGHRCRLAPLASGPLDGLAFAVKDLIDVAGEITGGGNPDWRSGQHPAADSAPAVQRLLEAGAALAGKTVTDELAFSLEGENVHTGTPVNPRAPGRLPGGSSSGSAVAVAAGLADLALGTDTGGSVRVPAGFCGIFGFRPSHGRVPLDGVIPFAPSYDTVGLFARDGALLEKAGRCLLEDAGMAAAPRRLLLARDAFALADPAAALVLRGAAEGLGAAEDADIYGGAAADFREAYRVLQGAEIATALGDWIRQRRPVFGETIAPRFADALSVTTDDVLRWRHWRQMAAGRIRDMLPPGTLLLLPTAPGIAPRRFLRDAAAGDFYAAALALTSVAGHAGLPALSLPLAELDGCPLGLSVLAGAGQDEALLAYAASLRMPS